MSSPAGEARDERILVLTPRGRDAALARDALATAGMSATLCPDLETLCQEIRAGAGAVLVADEALSPARVARLAETLAGEPGWSELPIIVLLGPGVQRDGRPHLLHHLQSLRNVTLLDRPVRIAGLLSTLSTALRARRRQYEIRDLMAQLQRALRTRDEFIAAVSHELRTPLNVILGWTTTLQRRANDAEQMAAAAKTIERNARVLWQLVEDLIDVARIASGRFQLRMQTVDVGAIAMTSVETLRPTADAKRITLTCEVAPGVPEIRGDDVRLQQVIWNIVWNALKFTPAGGRIDVTVAGREGAAEIVVADTGAGIDPNILPQIFEPFRQGMSSAADPHRGLGLGLAIVRHLVELHGGTIVAASAGLGHGAQFRISLPARTAAEPGEETAQPPAATHYEASGS